MRNRFQHCLMTMLVVLVVNAAAADDVTVQLGAGDGFVIQDSTGTVERLRVDEATGNVSKDGVLFLHTTGSDGTFLGENAGANNTPILTSGERNTAFGYNALRIGRCPSNP